MKMLSHKILAILVLTHLTWAANIPAQETKLPPIETVATDDAWNHKGRKSWKHFIWAWRG